MKETPTYWAAANPEGMIWPPTISFGERYAREKLVALSDYMNWRSAYRAGWRCVRVEIRRVR